MTQISGRQILIAAAIIGAASVAGSLLVAQSLNQVSEQLEGAAGRLDEIRLAVVEAKEELGKLQVAGAAAPARKAGLDPEQRYAINVDSAPALGPKSASVTIAEFADFQ